MKRAIFIGPLGYKGEATNKDLVINHQQVEKLLQAFSKIHILDTKKRAQTPLVIVKLLWYLLIFRRVNIIVSTDTESAYRLFKYAYLLLKSRNVYYFVLGENLHKGIQQGKYDIKYYKHLNGLLVASEYGLNELNRCGLNNVKILTRFKSYVPKINTRKQGTAPRIRFVFLAKILPERGCDLILEAVQQLNQAGYQERFTVTFYGPLGQDYAPTFRQRIEILPNSAYDGVLNMNIEEDIEIFRMHDVLLLPTLEPFKGFPTCIFDAYQAGMPIIATRWKNNDYIKDKQTGFLIDCKTEQLAAKMQVLIEQPGHISAMKENCLKEAERYNATDTISKRFTSLIGL